jgi:phosphate transport system substrate-binding protein
VSTGQYPGARPLYIYVKKAHIAAIPGLRGYMEEFVRGWDPGSYLTQRGMIAAPDDVRQANALAVKNLTTVDGASLK